MGRATARKQRRRRIARTLPVPPGADPDELRVALEHSDTLAVLASPDLVERVRALHFGPDPVEADLPPATVAVLRRAGQLHLFTFNRTD